MPNDTGERTPAVGSFEEMPLHPTIRAGVRELGYTEPTPIQRRTIPDAVLGRDLIGTAQTGTGKTAAFLLPILERLLDHPNGRILALVLTPTRELALQAKEFLDKLGRHTRLHGAAVYGGVGMGEQERALRGGAEIVVATPGRLLDHMSRGYVNYSSLEILVLDEADRMLDMGFLPDVRKILSRLPPRRQTMLFSATMPPEVVRLARDFLHDPKTVQVDETAAAAVGVSHLGLPVPAHLKTELLIELLRDETMASVLVFTRTKHRADRLARQLAQRGVDATVIHGDRSQAQRVKALEGFKTGRHRVLVATDIAARGIDVEGVSHVVNYDIPGEPDVYIHRVGRTARAQRLGDAYSLVGREEEDDFHRIEQRLGVEIRRARVPGFNYEQAAPDRPPSSAGQFRGGGGGRRDRRGPPPRGRDRGGGDRGGRPRRGRPSGGRPNSEPRRERRAVW
ncbi:MAG TPA: DEAD/DEAH box helicase [Thermoplasmata archaeon]|nr:DEAD/DEAH box helicase [Thermoplasmata archaeon]